MTVVNKVTIYTYSITEYYASITNQFLCLRNWILTAKSTNSQNHIYDNNTAIVF